MIDPVARRVRETRLDDRPQEFPRHDPRVALRRHRYGYTSELATGEAATANLHGAILKHDVETEIAALRRRMEVGPLPLAKGQSIMAFRSRVQELFGVRSMAARELIIDPADGLVRLGNVEIAGPRLLGRGQRARDGEDALETRVDRGPEGIECHARVA